MGRLFLQQAEGVLASIGGNERQEICCGRVGADVEGIDTSAHGGGRQLLPSSQHVGQVGCCQLGSGVDGELTAGGIGVYPPVVHTHNTDALDRQEDGR